MAPSDVNEAVDVVAYKSEWADQGLVLAQQIGRLLGGDVDVQHIGSTAVPGLAAKPILDIGVALPGSRWLSATLLLRESGFEDLGEAGVVGRRYLRQRETPPRANVHLLAPDGHLWLDNVMLRDYLRGNPEAAGRYAKAKIDAARQHPMLLSYSAAKDEIVRQLVAEARSEPEIASEVPTLEPRPGLS